MAQEARSFLSFCLWQIYRWEAEQGRAVAVSKSNAEYQMIQYRSKSNLRIYKGGFGYSVYV